MKCLYWPRPLPPLSPSRPPQEDSGPSIPGERTTRPALGMMDLKGQAPASLFRDYAWNRKCSAFPAHDHAAVGWYHSLWSCRVYFLTLYPTQCDFWPTNVLLWKNVEAMSSCLISPRNSQPEHRVRLSNVDSGKTTPFKVGMLSFRMWCML